MAKRAQPKTAPDNPTRPSVNRGLHLSQWWRGLLMFGVASAVVVGVLRLVQHETLVTDQLGRIEAGALR